MQKNKILMNKSELEMLFEAQASIVSGYDVKTEEGQCALAVEQQSADFLDNFLEGRLVLSDEAVALLPQYFSVLKKSKYKRISANIEKAENILKRRAIEQNKQAERNKRLNEQQERANYWKATQFNILSKKKEVQKLSSADLLLISKMINEVTEYSTTKNKDRLRSIINLRISDILSGKIEADENFAELVDKFGTLEQKKSASKFVKPENKQNDVIVTPKAKKTESDKKKVDLVAIGDDKNIYIPAEPKKKNNAESSGANGKVATPNNKKGKPSNKNQKSNKQGWWKKVWQKVKRPVLILGVAALGFLGVRSVVNSLTSSNNPKDVKDPKTTENVIPVTNEPTAPVDVIEVENTQKPMSEKEKAFEAAKKNRFDTALSIHLGNAERDKLYQKIEELEKAGKIKYENGTTREWYAYAFTILNKVAPNSKENSVVKSFLNGGNVDAKYINDLAIKINPRGTGIKGVGSHSAYDNASDDMKKKHKDALKTFNLLDAELNM